jgi:hypothetical protein
MADRLKVDVDGLEALASSLERIRGTLRATRDTVETARGDLGSADLADALGAFERHWRDGRERIEGSGETLTAMLRESVAAYRATDTDLAASIEESTRSGPEVAVPRGAL